MRRISSDGRGSITKHKCAQNKRAKTRIQRVIPATKVIHFEPAFRSEVDRLRSKVLELWPAPHLDERALSHVYARLVEAFAHV